MSQNKNYIVEKTLSYEEYFDFRGTLNEEFSYLDAPNKTDIFNKPSKTTVCFYGAMDSKVMYCENCKKTHYDNMDIIVEYRNYFKDSIKSFNISQVVCKDCGSSYNLEDIRIISRYSKNESVSSRLVYHNIYNDNDNLVKFSFKACSMVVERAFYSVDNSYKIIFNSKTGQTYIFNASGNRKNKIRFIDYKLPITNITYSCNKIDRAFRKTLIDVEDMGRYKLDIIKEIYANLYEKISKNLGYNPTNIEDYAKEMGINDENKIYTIQNLALYNRFPNANTFLLKKMGENEGFYPLDRMRKIKNTSKDPIQELLDAYNVKNRQYFEEIVVKSPDSDRIYLLFYLYQLFENEGYILNLYQSMEKESVFSYVGDFNRAIKNNNTEKSYTMKFLKNILKFSGEDGLYKILNTYSISTMDNFSSILYDIKKVNPKLKLRFDKIYEIFEDISNEDISIRERNARIKCSIQELALNELNKSLYNSFKSKFNFNVKTVDEYYNDAISNYSSIKDELGKYNLIISKLYKLAPTFNPYILAIMINRNYTKSYTQFDNLNLSHVVDSLSTNVLKDLFDYFNIPYVKSLRKYILKNPWKMPELIYHSIFFKDVNILKNIIVNKKMSDNYYNNLSFANAKSYADATKIYKVKDREESRDTIVENKINFLKYMVEQQGENIVGNKLMNLYSLQSVRGSQMYIDDTSNMFALYEEIYGEKYNDLTGTIIDIHDRLVLLTGGKRTPLSKDDFKPYKYSDKHHELEYNSKGYSFELPVNGKQVIEIGSTLHNCVGTYRNAIKRKSSLIVVCKYNGEYRICIELKPTSSDMYEVVQAKLDYNKAVYNSEQDLEVVLEWINKNNIQIKRCSDIINSKAKLLDNYNYNYQNNEENMQGHYIYDNIDFPIEAIAMDAIPF